MYFIHKMFYFTAVKNSLDIHYMNAASPSYEMSGVFSGLMPQETFCHIDHVCTVSLSCESSSTLRADDRLKLFLH